MRLLHTGHEGLALSFLAAEVEMKATVTDMV